VSRGFFFFRQYFRKTDYMRDINDIFLSLAPPERDETGSPLGFRKDELLQFLRVCF
jgi:hypothetical protein